MIKKLKILFRGYMLLAICMLKKFLKLFTKNCKKQIKKSLELKKKSIENLINHMLNGKVAIIFLTAGLMKRCIINV